MKSYHYYACIFNGEVYCNECLPCYVAPTSQGVAPIFPDSEWDYYPICCECGEIHDYVVLLTEWVT